MLILKRSNIIFLLPQLIVANIIKSSYGLSSEIELPQGERRTPPNIVYMGVQSTPRESATDVITKRKQQRKICIVKPRSNNRTPVEISKRIFVKKTPVVLNDEQTFIRKTPSSKYIVNTAPIESKKQFFSKVLNDEQPFLTKPQSLKKRKPAELVFKVGNHTYKYEPVTDVSTRFFWKKCGWCGRRKWRNYGRRKCKWCGRKWHWPKHQSPTRKKEPIQPKIIIKKKEHFVSVPSPPQTIIREKVVYKERPPPPPQVIVKERVIYKERPPIIYPGYPGGHFGGQGGFKYPPGTRPGGSGHIFIPGPSGSFTYPGNGPSGSITLPGNGPTGSITYPGNGPSGSIILPGNGPSGSITLPGNGPSGSITLPGNGQASGGLTILDKRPEFLGGGSVDINVNPGSTSAHVNGNLHGSGSVNVNGNLPGSGSVNVNGNLPGSGSINILGGNNAASGSSSIGGNPIDISALQNSIMGGSFTMPGNTNGVPQIGSGIIGNTGSATVEVNGNPGSIKINKNNHNLGWLGTNPGSSVQVNGGGGTGSVFAQSGNGQSQVNILSDEEPSGNLSEINGTGEKENNVSVKSESGKQQMKLLSDEEQSQTEDFQTRSGIMIQHIQPSKIGYWIKSTDEKGDDISFQTKPRNRKQLLSDEESQDIKINSDSGRGNVKLLSDEEFSQNRNDKINSDNQKESYVLYQPRSENKKQKMKLLSDEDTGYFFSEDRKRNIDLLQSGAEQRQQMKILSDEEPLQTENVNINGNAKRGNIVFLRPGSESNKRQMKLLSDEESPQNKYVKKYGGSGTQNVVLFKPRAKNVKQQRMLLSDEELPGIGKERPNSGIQTKQVWGSSPYGGSGGGKIVYTMQRQLPSDNQFIRSNSGSIGDTNKQQIKLLSDEIATEAYIGETRRTEDWDSSKPIDGRINTYKIPRYQIINGIGDNRKQYKTGNTNGYIRKMEQVQPIPRNTNEQQIKLLSDEIAEEANIGETRKTEDWDSSKPIGGRINTYNIPRYQIINGIGDNRKQFSTENTNGYIRKMEQFQPISRNTNEQQIKLLSDEVAEEANIGETRRTEDWDSRKPIDGRINTYNIPRYKIINGIGGNKKHFKTGNTNGYIRKMEQVQPISRDTNEQQIKLLSDEVAEEANIGETRRTEDWYQSKPIGGRINTYNIPRYQTINGIEDNRKQFNTRNTNGYIRKMEQVQTIPRAETLKQQMKLLYDEGMETERENFAETKRTGELGLRNVGDGRIIRYNIPHNQISNGNGYMNVEKQKTGKKQMKLLADEVTDTEKDIRNIRKNEKLFNQRKYKEDSSSYEKVPVSKARNKINPNFRGASNRKKYIKHLADEISDKTGALGRKRGKTVYYITEMKPKMVDSIQNDRKQFNMKADEESDTVFQKSFKY